MFSFTGLKEFLILCSWHIPQHDLESMKLVLQNWEKAVVGETVIPNASAILVSNFNMSIIFRAIAILPETYDWSFWRYVNQATLLPSTWQFILESSSPDFHFLKFNLKPRGYNSGSFLQRVYWWFRWQSCRHCQCSVKIFEPPKYILTEQYIIMMYIFHCRMQNDIKIAPELRRKYVTSKMVWSDATIILSNSR